MIKSIYITNFQSHKDTRLEFDPGVNVILGASDSGKTAIIRALRWLAFNRPQGDSFRSHWGGVCSIEATFDNHTITRKKDKVDEYILDEESYKAFRTEVPEDIIKALDINDINLQMQLDAPFLLSKTPGAVAQHFNKVAKIDKIDKGLSNVQSWIRKLSSNITYSTEQIKKQEEELKKFEHLPKLEVEIEVLESLSQQLDAVIKRKSKLVVKISDIQELNCLIQEETILTEMELSVNKLLALYRKQTELLKAKAKITNVLSAILKITKRIENHTVLIGVENQVNDVLTLYTQYNTKESQRSKLRKALNSLNNTQTLLNKEKEKFERKQAEFKKNFPEVCPLCNSIVKK